MRYHSRQTLAVVINTCATQRNSSSAGVPHCDRAYALRNFIIPYYQHHPGVDELIVVGEWEPGDYIYVHSPSEHFNWNDALVQRQRGFAASQSAWIAFSHDDHWIELPKHWTPPPHSDVVVPDRWTRLRKGSGERLNNGRNERYVMGHCALYAREVIYNCPWDGVPPTRRIWDVQHTEMIVDRGYHIHWDDGLIAWDVEMGAQPWH
jgi:hypothetical protein